MTKVPYRAFTDAATGQTIYVNPYAIRFILAAGHRTTIIFSETHSVTVTVDPEGDLDVVGRKMAFKVTNTGFTTLHEVQPVLGLCQIAFGGKLDPKYQCGGPLGSKLVPAMLKIGTLTMDEKQSFRFDDG